MEQPFYGVEVLFVAGFGPITQNTSQSAAFYQQALGLPLKPMEGNEDYLLTEHDALAGVKHFALWPLAQAAQSCFGQDQWPQDLPVPQAWMEFDVADYGEGHPDAAGSGLSTAGSQPSGAVGPERHPSAKPGRLAGRRDLNALDAPLTLPGRVMLRLSGLEKRLWQREGGWVLAHDIDEDVLE